MISSGLVLLCATGCSSMSLASDPDEPVLYHPPVAEGHSYCGDDYEACLLLEIADQQRQQIEHDRLQAEKDRELAQAQHERQVEATLRAGGLAPGTGTGWWCFAGTMNDQPLGECHHSQEDCITYFLRRERAGFQPAERRCSKQALAACFVVTRNLEEGARSMCFDTVATCERLRGGVDPKAFASPPTECHVTD